MLHDFTHKLSKVVKGKETKAERGVVKDGTSMGGVGENVYLMNLVAFGKIKTFKGPMTQQ